MYRHVFCRRTGRRALFRGDIRVHAVNLMGAVAMVVQALDPKLAAAWSQAYATLSGVMRDAAPASPAVAGKVR